MGSVEQRAVWGVSSESVFRESDRYPQADETALQARRGAPESAG